MPGLNSISPMFGWALAVAAIAMGYTLWGWPGVVLAITVVVFWLLLQFSVSLRVLRAAGSRPIGHVESALMLHTQLTRGLQMMQLVKLTKSLGERVRESPETWRWHDAGGDAVDVELDNGRVQAWHLLRGVAVAAAVVPTTAPSPATASASSEASESAPAKSADRSDPAPPT